ncbi:DUF6777 domain-containing protein [Streptomyces sp. NPDC002537]
MRLVAVPFASVLSIRARRAPATRRAALRRRRLRIVSLLTVPVVLGGAAVVSCTSEQKKKIAQLTLEAVGVTGDHPFARNPGTDLKGVNSPSGGGGEKPVDARGAFGGTPGAVHCDKALLIKQITQDPAEAKAWAAVRGIDAGRIAAHIDSLTEVVLLDDTLVKNHDYQGDGRTREYLSVLQKGVVVLNDPYTGPAVKCNCGNPLGEPDHDVDLQASSYTGVRWAAFSDTEVTVIKPRPKDKGPVKEIPLVDPFQSDKAFDRQVGTDGNQDSATFHWNPPPRATPSGRPTGTGPGDRSPTPGERTPSGTPGEPTPSAEPSSPGTAPPSSATPPPTASRTGGPPTEGATGPTKAPPTTGKLPSPEAKPPSTAGKVPPTAVNPPPTRAVPSSTVVKSPPAEAKPPTTAGAKPPTAVEPTAVKPPPTVAQPPPTRAKPPPTEPKPPTEHPATYPPPAEHPATYPPAERPPHPPTAVEQPPAPPRRTAEARTAEARSAEPRQGNR